MSKQKPPIDLYADQMREIKQRTEVIDYFLYKGGSAIYESTNVETICLQFRKILELIAFSSLIANRAQYSKSRALYLAPQIFIRRIGINAGCLKAGVPKQSLNDIHRNAG